MARTRYDLVVLDVMMPGEDDLSIPRSLDRDSRPAVVMQTVIGTDIDRIIGPEMGADDYVAERANPRELLARIRSVLRRAGSGAGHVAPPAPPRATTASPAGDSTQPVAGCSTRPTS